MAYFDGIKVGDRVYDMRWGWGEVVNVGGGNYPISVDFEPRIRTSFCMDGKWTDDSLQTLFWSKPEFIPPPRPKRVVKRTIERWVNVYDGPELADCFMNEKQANYGHTVFTRSSAYTAMGCPCRIARVRLTGEYEVEE